MTHEYACSSIKMSSYQLVFGIVPPMIASFTVVDDAEEEGGVKLTPPSRTNRRPLQHRQARISIDIKLQQLILLSINIIGKRTPTVACSTRCW